MVAGLMAFVTLLSVTLCRAPSWSVPLGAGETRFHIGLTPERRPWIRPGTRLLLHGADGGPFVLALRLLPDGHLAEADRVLEVRQEDRTLARLQLAPSWSDYRILVPAPPLFHSLVATVPLELSCLRYVTAKDGEDRCVRVESIRVEARSSGIIRPFLRALWLSLLVVAVYLLGLRIMASQSTSRSIPLATAISVGAALVAWAWRNPYTLAWALPPMVALVALCAVGLAAFALRGRARPQFFWIGLVLTVLAQASFTARSLGGVGLGLLATGFLFLVAAKAKHPEDERPPPAWTPWLLLGVLGVALSMRFVGLREVPFGLWRDEARHGLIALRILEDPAYRPIYVAEGGVNMPALGFYPFVLGILGFGIEPWSLRPVAAAAGGLGVLLLSLLAFDLTRRWEVAILAGWFEAASSWHTALSRYIFPTVFDPLCTLGGLALLWRGWGSERGRRHDGGLLLAGLLVGAATQTYHSGKVAPLMAAATIAWLKVHRGSDRRGLLAFGLGLGAAVLPMLWFGVVRPEALEYRVRQVFLVEVAYRSGKAPLTEVDASLGRHATMFNRAGDPAGRLHPAHAPMLELPAAVAFVVGLAGVVRAGAANPAWLAALWLVVGLLPSVLAVEGPHAMRSVGAVGPACLLAALGVLEILRRLPLPATRSSLRPLVGVGVAALGLGLGAHRYFVDLAGTAWRATYPVHTAVGAFAREALLAQPARAVYVDAQLVSNSVMAFLTHGLTVRTFSGDRFSRFPAAGDLAILSGPEAEAQKAALAECLPGTPFRIGPTPPGASWPAFVAYELRCPGARGRAEWRTP